MFHMGESSLEVYSKWLTVLGGAKAMISSVALQAKEGGGDIIRQDTHTRAATPASESIQQSIMAAQAALSASAFVAPAARLVGSKNRSLRSMKKSHAFKCKAIYTESARVPTAGADSGFVKFEDERRWRETARVMERTQEIHTMQELGAAFTLAGDKLVMVALDSDEECTMAEEFAENTPGTETNQEQCRQLSSSLSRIAREADDVAFLKVEADMGGGRDVAQQLGVTRYPTFQYYKVRERDAPLATNSRAFSPSLFPPRYGGELAKNIFPLARHFFRKRRSYPLFSPEGKGGDDLHYKHARQRRRQQRTRRNCITDGETTSPSPLFPPPSLIILFSIISFSHLTK
jgi:hypothetical protein